MNERMNERTNDWVDEWRRDIELRGPVPQCSICGDWNWMPRRGYRVSMVTMDELPVDVVVKRRRER